GFGRPFLVPIQLPALAAILDQAGIEAGAAGRRVRLQLDRGRAPVAAVERRVLDPFAQLALVAQHAADGEPEHAGLGIVEPRLLAAGAAMAMDELELGLAHLPALAHELDEQPVP